MLHNSNNNWNDNHDSQFIPSQVKHYNDNNNDNGVISSHPPPPPPPPPPPLQTTTTTSFIGVESSSNTCPQNNIPDLTDLMTRFLSLDKCLPRRQHIQIVNIECPPQPQYSNISENTTMEQQHIQSNR